MLEDELMLSGQWRDSETGLIWMRCLIGQTWTGTSCEGDGLKLYWEGAVNYMEIFNKNGGFAGHTNWRLPTIEELLTIRKCRYGCSDELFTLPNGEKVPESCVIHSDVIVSSISMMDEQNVLRSDVNVANAPPLDTYIFPNPPFDYWSSWSSTSYLKINFVDGYLSKSLMGHYMRAVRSDQ